MTKPIVFNYQDYEKLLAENERLKERIEELEEINTEQRQALFTQRKTENGTDKT